MSDTKFDKAGRLIVVCVCASLMIVAVVTLGGGIQILLVPALLVTGAVAFGGALAVTAELCRELAENSHDARNNIASSIRHATVNMSGHSVLRQPLISGHSVLRQPLIVARQRAHHLRLRLFDRSQLANPNPVKSECDDYPFEQSSKRFCK